MDQNGENVEEIYNQDGILLLAGPATHMGYMKVPGTIYITKCKTSETVDNLCIEWKPNDNLTIDSDIQDQEWALVNTIERRTRTLSGSSIPDEASRSKYLRIKICSVQSIKATHKNQKLSFIDGMGEIICSFQFQNANACSLITALKSQVHMMPTKRDKNTYMVKGPIRPEDKQLEKSFKHLDLFSDGEQHNMWNFVKNFQTKPYETTLGAFAKVTDIVYRSSDHKYLDDYDREELSKSLTIATECGPTQEEYEVVAPVSKLPERKECPRGKPLTIEQWRNLQDFQGRIEDIESTKLVIFNGGLVPPLRKTLWKYLLNYFPWDSSQMEREKLVREKEEEYYKMKAQWLTISKTQEDNFSDYRDRRSLIEKDVNRTDRAYSFYEGDNNPNLIALHDILMTYVMYNFDLGYVQGMSDLLSPILCLMENEVDAFWCFVGFMNKVYSNFDIDQAGMKEQLLQLHMLLTFVEPELAHYLDEHDSGNMFFCFRWLLVWFKRELDQEDILRLWEVLWTELPCNNFHLLMCVAILETEKRTLIENNYGFTEILKHINDLSSKLDISFLLNKAEGIFHQIEEAGAEANSVRIILGLPELVSERVNNGTDTNIDSPNANSFTYVESCNDHDNVTIGANEVCYERALLNSFM